MKIGMKCIVLKVLVVLVLSPKHMGERSGLHAHRLVGEC